MKKIFTVATVCIVALGFGTGAVMARDFAHADENKDGKVSWTEAFGDTPTLTEVLFKAADSNKDGSLDEGEYGLLFGLGGCAVK